MQSNIRKLRNERNISQTTLAEVLGKTQQTVSHMEKDRNRIPIESLIAMSEYFGVSTDYILGIAPERGNTLAENTDRVDYSSFSKESEDIKKLASNVDDKVLYELVLALLLRSLEEKAPTP